MEFSGPLFAPSFHWILTTLYLLVLFYAIRQAPWRRLYDGDLMNVLFGSCVVLLLLWSMRVTATEHLTFHLLAITTITLMFGWSVAVLVGTLVLAGVVLNGGGSWQLFPLNAFTTAIAPASLTMISLVVVRSLLPKNFFIYVLVNGFLTSGVAALVSGYLAVGLLVMSGASSLIDLRSG